MTYDPERLKVVKSTLAAARKAARKKARELEVEITAAVNSEVDTEAKLAYQSGMSKSAIAAALGESRVTVNDRLRRMANVSVADLIGERRDKGLTAMDVQSEPEVYEVPAVDEFPTYKIVKNEADRPYLQVSYRGYGPEEVTGDSILEIVYDEDEEIYWFVGENAVSSIADRLDTVFSGWYYEDAQEFVKNELRGGE